VNRYHYQRLEGDICIGEGRLIAETETEAIAQIQSLYGFHGSIVIYRTVPVWTPNNDRPINTYGGGGNDYECITCCSNHCDCLDNSTIAAHGDLCDDDDVAIHDDFWQEEDGSFWLEEDGQTWEHE